MGGGEAGRRPRERLAATEDELAVAEGKDNRERESERECVRERELNGCELFKQHLLF